MLEKNSLAEAIPLWRKAQSRLVEELGRERWSGFLDDLTETVAIIQGRRFLCANKCICTFNQE